MTTVEMQRKSNPKVEALVDSWQWLENELKNFEDIVRELESDLPTKSGPNRTEINLALNGSLNHSGSNEQQLHSPRRKGAPPPPPVKPKPKITGVKPIVPPKPRNFSLKNSSQDKSPVSPKLSSSPIIQTNL